MYNLEAESITDKVSYKLFPNIYTIFQLDMLHQVSSPIVQNSKKFVRQEALETDDVSTSSGCDRIHCAVKATTDEHEEIQELNVSTDRTFERNWSTTSQHTTESGSEYNFSLLPDSDLSRSSEASSDKESFASEIHHVSEHEEFSINKVELGMLKSCTISLDNLGTRIRIH